MIVKHNPVERVGNMLVHHPEPFTNVDMLQTKDGVEFYGMRSDSTAWMCVFHRHGMCVADECICTCH